MCSFDNASDSFASYVVFFFFNDTATTEIYTLSLHDALPICNVPASYTNIALMTAFLLQFGAARFGEPAWLATAERLAGEVLARFQVNSAFDEYNSPTYYGIDLYALALWRSYAASPLLRRAGVEMEGALWRDIAQF